MDQIKEEAEKQPVVAQESSEAVVVKKEPEQEESAPAPAPCSPVISKTACTSRRL